MYSNMAIKSSLKAPLGFQNPNNILIFNRNTTTVKVSRLMKGNKRFINDNGKLKREKTFSFGIAP